MHLSFMVTEIRDFEDFEVTTSTLHCIEQTKKCLPCYKKVVKDGQERL